MTKHESQLSSDLILRISPGDEVFMPCFHRKNEIQKTFRYFPDIMHHTEEQPPHIDLPFRSECEPIKAFMHLDVGENGLHDPHPA
jgi:hypothetical protein